MKLMQIPKSDGGNLLGTVWRLSQHNWKRFAGMGGGVVGGDIRFILTAAKTPDTKTTSGFPEQEAASVTTGFSLESQQC